MKITYKVDQKKHSFEQLNPKHKTQLSFVHSNSQGDVLTCGILGNTSKFQGFLISDRDNGTISKIIDEFVTFQEIDSVETSLWNTKRTNSKNLFSDSFYLGPTGGIIYEYANADKEIFLDLDCHKYGDFDEWGRNYSVSIEEDILYVHYKKELDSSKEYELHFGVDISSLSYDLKQEWISKEYSYSKEREYNGERYIYRLLSLSDGSQKVICGASKSKSEVKNQILLLRDHEKELKNFDKELDKNLKPTTYFKTPLSEEVETAYELSIQKMYVFMNKDFTSEKLLIKNGCYAGFPWFTQVWSRDDLIASRGFLELGDYSLVKEKLFSYLNALDEESGLLPILSTKGTLSSPDSCFWLAKRIEDFIYTLGELGKLRKYLSVHETSIIYKKLSKSFNRIITSNWDVEEELLKVKPGDSWMDTIELYYPLDIQVQLLGMVSTLIDLSVINHKEDTQRYLDLEFSLKEKIKSVYWRNGALHNNPQGNEITSNTFLVYYLYPNLFYKSEWEQIFDKSLKELKTSWGGISTLSKFHNEYHDTYSGENNKSYHRGDSWFWINNLAAITMYDLNRKKYRKEISKILQSSTQDILKMGTLGFGSEVSSAKEQLAQGAHAQLWSTSTYIELVHKLFEKE